MNSNWCQINGWRRTWFNFLGCKLCSYNESTELRQPLLSIVWFLGKLSRIWHKQCARLEKSACASTYADAKLKEFLVLEVGCGTLAIGWNGGIEATSGFKLWVRKIHNTFHGLRFKLEYRVHSALHLWPSSCRLVRKCNLSFFIHRSLVGILETCRNVSMLSLWKDWGVKHFPKNPFPTKVAFPKLFLRMIRN